MVAFTFTLHVIELYSKYDRNMAFVHVWSLAVRILRKSDVFSIQMNFLFSKCNRCSLDSLTLLHLISKTHCTVVWPLY